MHLFPDVIVRKKTAQLSFRQWSIVVRVAVSREHMDTHGMNFTDIHCSIKKKGNVTLERKAQMWWSMGAEQ